VKYQINVFGKSVCSYFSWYLYRKIVFSEVHLLQPLRWRCVDCVIHHERDVREEQHDYICSARKQ